MFLVGVGELSCRGGVVGDFGKDEGCEVRGVLKEVGRDAVRRWGSAGEKWGGAVGDTDAIGRD